MKKLIAVWLAVLLTAVAVQGNVNISPYTKKLRQGDVATNFAFIRNDTLFCDSMSVSVHNLMKAVAAQVDTVRGSSSIVGILDSAIRIDPDSSSEVVVITFGGYGGGLRWNQATDEMQYTNDFSTWTAIGTGGTSSTDADSLNHKVVRIRPLTDGYVLKYDSDGDSLYLSADATGAAGDSNAITYEADRIGMYTDTGLYLGDVGDSTMIRFLGDSTIIAFTKIYYGEEAVDSALITQGTLDAAIAALGNGDITGVITSDWLIGGAASGDVALGIDPTVLSAVNIGDDTVRIQNGTSSGRIVLNVDGTPANTDELTVTENNIEIRSAGSNGTLYLSGYDLERVAHVAVGSMFTSGGTSSAPTWQSIKTVLDSLTGTAIPLADSTNGGAIRATTSKTADSTNGGAIRATTSKTADSTNGGAIRATTSKMSDSVGGTWLRNFIDTLTQVKIPVSDSTNGGAIRSMTTKLADSTVGGSVRATTSKTADSTNGGAIRSETTKLLLSTQGGANTAGRLTADSIIVDTLFATRGNFTNLKVGTDVFITDITGDGLAMSGSALTASLGTAITSGEITDDEVSWSDLDSTTSRTYIFDIVKDSLWQNTPNYFKTAGNGLTSSTSTVNVVVGANGLTVNADSLYIDTTKVLRTKNLIANWVTPWPDSVLGLGSGAGLTIGSAITLGTDITDDSLVQEFWPEYAGMTLFRGFSATDIAYNDSIVIRGDADSANGNFLMFNDSTLTAGNHRRHVTIAIPVPDRVDSLRRVTVQVMSKDSTTGSVEFFMRAALFTRPPAYSLVDSAVGGSVLDRDSSCAAILRTLHLAPGSGKWAVTPFTTKYLLLSGRRDAGNAWNWGKAYKITAVWDRTKL